jgi:renalase
VKTIDAPPSTASAESMHVARAGLSVAKHSETPKVAIIGAGLAGVTAAMRLEKNGVDVTLFEKSRGVSGRMSTRRNPLNDTKNTSTEDVLWQYDHGAQYFIANDATFRAEVSRWQSLGIAAPWSPTIAVLGTLGHSQLIAMPGGETVRDGSQAMAFTRWVGTPRMSSIVSNLAKTLRGRAMLETTVTTLTQSGMGWQLTTLEHGAIESPFDAVLLALPAPQARMLLQTAAPAGAALSALAANDTMCACWSVMLHLNEPPSLAFDAAVVGVGPLRWIARDNSKPRRPNIETWVLHASADWSATHIEASKEFVMRELIHAFSGSVGTQIKPIQATVHRWRYATTHAYVDDETSPPLSSQCHWQQQVRLGMCGDWMAGGTVEGAWLSGSRLASMVTLDLTNASAHPKS